LDPYYDIAFSDDKRSMRIVKKKKKEGNSNVDYFSDPIRKDILIKKYINET
jgi:uncharacterized protein YukJ